MPQQWIKGNEVSLSSTSRDPWFGPASTEYKEYKNREYFAQG
jgi:hypothetical protein